MAGKTKMNKESWDLTRLVPLQVLDRLITDHIEHCIKVRLRYQKWCVVAATVARILGLMTGIALSARAQPKISCTSAHARMGPIAEATKESR